VAPSPSPRLSYTLKWMKMIPGIRKLILRSVVAQPKVNYSVQVMFRYCVKFMVICSDVIEPKQ